MSASKQDSSPAPPIGAHTNADRSASAAPSWILAREEIEDVRGESRWPPALTLLVAIVVPLLLPDRFSLAPNWIGPALLTTLLAAHAIADPGRIDRQSRAARAIGIALMAVLVAGAATQAVVSSSSWWAPTRR